MSAEHISDAELDRILNLDRANGNVNMLRPMEIALSRDLLTEHVRTDLERLRALPTDPDATVQERRLRLRAIQQRLDFLAWLNGQPELVEVAIYPSSELGLTEDDLADLIEDGLLPFDDDEVPE